MIRVLRAACCLAIFASTAAQAEWIRVATADTGSVWYMDADRVRTVGANRQAWVKIDHSLNRAVSYRSSLRLFSVNCGAQTMRLLSVVDYDSQGRIVRSESQPDYSYGGGYDPVVPDTVGETVSRIACAAAN